MTKDGRKSHTDDNWQGIKRGQLLWNKERGGPFKVMAVVDGYVVMRRPGCMPFIEAVRDVGRKWLTADPVTPNAKSEPTAQLLAQVGSTDGLGNAVPPAPTFGETEK